MLLLILVDIWIDLAAFPDSISLAAPSPTCVAQLTSFTPQDPSDFSNTCDGSCPIWIDQEEKAPQDSTCGLFANATSSATQAIPRVTFQMFRWA